VAPQPTYREEYLPRIWEAIDRGEWDAVPGYEAEVVAAFDRAADILRRARQALPGSDTPRRENGAGAPAKP
jgi:hypothetical protein